MLRFYVLEPWNMLGLWWLDRGARSNQVQALMGGSLGELPEPFAIYSQKEASLKLWLTWGTDLCSRFSSKDQCLEIKGMWVRRGGSESVEFKPTACQL